jgi:flagellar biogenesis protein FliO
MKYIALLDLTSSVHSAAELDGNMMHGTQNGMMSGTMMQGMGWGWMLLCLLFALLFFAVLVWIVMALLTYLRKPN